ncbi:MAG: prolyl oligopeptidase family serine peptidase [Ferruginibacter sp.]
MIKKSLFIFWIICLVFRLQIFAQEQYIFKQGLLINAGYRYGREALYKDELAWQLYNNKLKTPADGAVMGNNETGEPVRWTAIVADSLNRLRSGERGGFGRGGSYIYMTYTSKREQAAILNIKGNSAVYVNGEPHMGDAYSLGYLHIPVKLKKGLNEFYVRGGSVTAGLIFPSKQISFRTDDLTLPAIVLDQSKELQGAIVVLNTSAKELKGLQIKSNFLGKEMISTIPVIPAMSFRKVPFMFDASGVTTKGKFDCLLTLMGKGGTMDTAKIIIESVNPTEQYSSTFISAVDNSLQYYAVTPQSSGATKNSALFLSVHGAGVEAIGQARAYKPKDWGTLVAATNRRPRGFNWEDWGRQDALEVLSIATEKFKPDPQHIYLTGHSMGGHGTWFLGATYPDKWAAIAPCSGYPTLKGYGSADGLVPDSSNDPMEQIMLRSGNQSDVIKLANNYKAVGVYVLHGDSDKVVSVNYARQMRKVLSDFHTDLSYYEYPGGEHWFGDQSVDWKPLFDFFKWHNRPVDSAINRIDFTTASPGISSSFRWASILQQQHPLQYSNIKLERNKAKNSINGTTTNTRLLKLDLSYFDANSSITITIDKAAPLQYTTAANDSIILLNDNGKWVIGSQPDLSQKGPHRYGTFKDAFNHNMVFVYGTTGTKEENEWSFNKARYDAETWYYRGNGAVDIISDKAFAKGDYKDRGVILFGNKSTNAAWNLLLADCPIQVERNLITAGNKKWTGDELSAFFDWPIRNSATASVAVVSGTGIKGMKAAFANQYFAGASGFPDFMIYESGMLQSGISSVKLAGFFDNDWTLNEGELIENK